MNCSLLGSFVHGIFQARIMEWVAICFSRVSSQPRDQTLVLLHRGQTLYHLSHQGSPNINMLYNLKVLVAPVMSNSLWPMDCSPPSLLCPWDFPNINTGVGCHSLLQGSSWSRDQTWVSCLANEFFTVWATPSTWVTDFILIISTVEFVLTKYCLKIIKC